MRDSPTPEPTSEPAEHPAANQSRARQQAAAHAQPFDALPIPPLPASPDALHADLAAEIADHLASAEADLVRKGHAPAEASQLARARFGDIARILRQCWWIQQGDQIMIRAITIALLAVLTITVAALTFAGFQAQRSFSTRMDRLSDQLTRLVEAQAAQVRQQSQLLPVRITGHAYLGDRDRPAAHLEIRLHTTEEQKVTRRLQTDAQGNFRFGALPPGGYSVEAPLLDLEGRPIPGSYVFQSGPLYLYESDQQATLELDLLAKTRVDFVLAEAFPDRIQAGDHVSTTVLEVFLIGPLGATRPGSTPATWPRVVNSQLSSEQKLPVSKLPLKLPIPSGEYRVSVALGATYSEPGYSQSERTIAWNELPELLLSDGIPTEVRVRVPEGLQKSVQASLLSQETFKKLEPQKLRLQVIHPTRSGDAKPAE